MSGTGDLKSAADIKPMAIRRFLNFTRLGRSRCNMMADH
jgi:hypothetical protein